MANKENLPPILSTQQISSISPSNKPALNRQRDHSACRRPETPLKVKKTRENLKQHSTYADIPPPCVHSPHDYTTCSLTNSNPTVISGSSSVKENGFAADHGNEAVSTLLSSNLDGFSSDLQSAPSASAIPALQRQKSASRRMLSKVKQGIANRTKVSQSNRTVDSETSSLCRITHRRKQSCEIEDRTPSFEISRDSIDSNFRAPYESIAIGPSTARSFTNSTVSTTEVFGDSSSSAISRTAYDPLEKPSVLDLSQFSNVSSPLAPPSPPETTPRPVRCNSGTVPQHISIKVPCIDLQVIADCATLDVHAKRDVWIAMVATVQACTSSIESTSVHTNSRCSNSRTASGAVGENKVDSLPHDQTHGVVTTMRLCFKPMGNCRVRDIVGRKTVKDVTIGHTCSLFVRLHVPRIRASGSEIDPDQESLFTELESIIGILETDILHVEARYRHSLFPPDNIVSVRYMCKMRRPQTGSRWSILDAAELQAISSEAQKRLARYLAAEYSPEQALELIQEYLDSTAKDDPEVCEIRKSLTHKFHGEHTGTFDGSGPSVVVTDIDWDPNISCLPVSDRFSTAPSTPVAEFHSQALPSLPNIDNSRRPSSKSLLAPTVLTLPLISAPKVTTALTRVTSPAGDSLEMETNPPSGAHDTARQLWRHIRHTSLSSRQLETLSSDGVEHLEASDDALKELRRRALANKRSVGAETLKGWKWDEEMRVQEHFGESPWM